MDMKSRQAVTGFVLALLFLSLSLSAQNLIFSVADFSVESDNSLYRYIGKGISTLIAGELRQSESVTILERQEMNKIIEEQKLSLSGFMDESSQLELGMLLSADYIVFGEIIDMATAFLVSVRMADVETGEVVWEDSLTESLDRYDYIGAYFARSILTELDLEIEEETLVKVDSRESKREEAVIALSSGIDAYDRGDEERAREELKTVTTLDPMNNTARFYLSKLQALSPKFRVENAPYITAYGAASLGFMTQGSLYFWTGITLPPPGVETTDSGAQVVGDYSAKESENTTFWGIRIPLGEKSGLDAGIFSPSGDTQAYYEGGIDGDMSEGSESQAIFEYDGEMVDGLKNYINGIGIFTGYGTKLNNRIGLGAAIMAWYRINGEEPGRSDTYGERGGDLVHEGLFFSFFPGIFVQGPREQFTWDFNVGITNSKSYYIDYEEFEIVLGQQPVVIDTSFTYGLLDQQLFLGLKGISDIFTDDRGGYNLRIIPMVEYWLFPFFSLRGGYEYSQLSQFDEFSIGNGGVGGFTLKAGRFDINANLTYRQKPATLLPGTTVANMKLLIGVEYKPYFLSRI